MGSRPLRMKVRWGCPPRVLLPPPHRTQSWCPCLPGQPWASGWRSTDRPVLSPRGWTIGFSERGAAHNLSSRRCMRSWRVRGWPFSRPEAARPPPPSSLPSMAEWPGGTRAFPRWRERSRCTCAHETPPLGGTVRVSRPRPVSWQPLSRPKLTVLQARQPPPYTPWLSCRFTKPRRSNRCTRVVPTRGWCRSCARRLTSLYERRKSRRGPSGKAMSTMVVQEARFLDAPISQGGLFGDTVEGFAQQFSAVQQQTEVIQHILPRRDAPSTAAPGARPQSARRRGRPPASSRAAPPQAESTHRPVRRASRRRAAPPASQSGPKSSRKSTKRPWRGQPGDVGVCSFSGDGENSAAPSPGGGPGGESSVSFCLWPTFSKKEQFPFPPGSQVHGTTVCDALPPHSRPRPILPVAKRVRFGDDIPPHAPLASPVRDPGSSVRMPQNAPPSVPSTPTPFRCTTTGTSIVPLEPLAQRLEAWLTLPSLGVNRRSLEVNRPPSPEPSRLDDWFLRAGRGSQPFFPEVHEELTSSWMALFTARSRSSASSILTTLDGGVARGYAGIPQVERAVAVHLCPRNAATWRNRPRLPSKACKLTAALAAKAYSAAGQAAAALHAMAILQVHQAKALKQVHEGSTDPGLMQELRTATDFALRATKVTARSLGEGDVHHGGPGGTLSRRPHLPGRAVRRHRRGLRPAVLGGTAADRGDPAHPAPAWCTIHRCPRGQASVCPSPWAPSCVLQGCSAPGRIDT